MANEIVKYESAYGVVELSADTVINYLARGNGKIEPREIKMFCELCKAQQLNPFINEAYLVKFGNQPANILIGYDTYKRRAFENPNFLSKESGIVVMRGSEIVKKEGACVYPTESLVGGWCRTHVVKGGKEITFYKECSLQEYNKKQALWNEKPAMMIEKVAISQCLREAFPREFEGIHSTAEMDYVEYDQTSAEEVVGEVVEVVEEAAPSKDELWSMINKAKEVKGTEAEIWLKAKLEGYGCSSTRELTRAQYEEILVALT